ncbi:MAG: family 16 glycosylhydrolase [candidate division SR1 bacterium]|nr:family 16 glycosylhydrolase [candidate division SR1 bacterium]
MKKIKELVIVLAIFSIATVTVKGQTTVNIFRDLFNGTSINSAWWYIPTWTGPSDGTYVGRTQFRCIPAALPSIINDNVYVNLETYNPTGFSMYGTDLITQKTFAPGNGLIISIRAKINNPMIGGIVAGLFSFDLIPPSNTIHNEIDWELLTNQSNYVHTNIYNNEPLGVGHPDSSQIVNQITDYHVFMIRWLPNEVTWYIDGILVRTSTNVPTAPTHFHLNMWAPAQEWSSAYNVALQPTNVQADNQIYSLLIDSIRIDSIINMTTIVSIKPMVAEVNFWPNPVHDVIHFNTSENIIVSIYSMNGSLVKETAINNGNISVIGLLPGIYVIKYTYNNKQTTKKLVIQ